jgi:flagellar hook-basal body complex protein FliE
MKVETGYGMPQPPQGRLKPEAAADARGPSFGELVQSSLSRVNRLQQDADQAIVAVSSGQSQHLHQTMIAMEKADTAFQYLMQIRNKIVSAYQEIMRMQL